MRALKISHIEAIAVCLPMARPMQMAGVLIESADNLLVRIESADGTVGWGEAASAPNMTGETVPGMAAAVRYLAPVLTGADAGDIDAACARMHARMYGNHAAKAAIEIALHDLLGRSLGKPVCELLGAKQRSRIALLWLLGTGSREGDLAEAAAKQAAGFVAFKVKVGIDTPVQDAQRTALVCEQLGNGVLVCADANQGFKVEQAIEYVQRVEATGLAFFEQPVRADDLAGMAQVARASRVPIGADEGLHCLADIRSHHELRAAAGGSLKTIKLGGLRGVVAGARLCESLGWNVNLACKVAESSIEAAAILHLAAVVPSLDWGVSLSSQYLADDVTGSPIAIERGHAEVPRGPGLGVEVDEARVRKYQVRV